MEDNIQTIDGKECTPLVRWDDSAWENPFEDSLEQGKREGREMGSAAGYEEGRQIGRALATEIGMEVGFISGCCEEILENLSSLLGEENTVKKEKVISNIEVVKKLIHENFGTTSSKDPTLLLHNYSYPHPDVQQCSSTSITSMDEPIRTSDTASKFLATRNEKVSSIFSDDLDVPKVLQNIRTRFKLILIQIKLPNHTYQNVIEWRADNSFYMRKSDQKGNFMVSSMSSSLEEW